MRYFINDEKVSLEELRERVKNLKDDSETYGEYETISLYEVDEEGNLHFEKFTNSVY